MVLIKVINQGNLTPLCLPRKTPCIHVIHSYFLNKPEPFFTKSEPCRVLDCIRAQGLANYRLLIWVLEWPSPGVPACDPLIWTQHVLDLGRRCWLTLFHLRELYEERYEREWVVEMLQRGAWYSSEGEHHCVCFDSVQATAVAQGSQIAHHHPFVSNLSQDLTHTLFPVLTHPFWVPRPLDSDYQDISSRPSPCEAEGVMNWPLKKKI